ncbi:MAG: hypothetical protein VKJ02_04515, partial [Snowella sp.]|nr:hypothetical protein [Snowella sp.]
MSIEINIQLLLQIISRIFNFAGYWGFCLGFKNLSEKCEKFAADDQTSSNLNKAQVGLRRFGPSNKDASETI